MLFSTAAAANAELDENSIFDKNRAAPSELLLKLYNENQILALGEPNHSQWRTLKYITDLLDVVGDDPKLKYVVIERFHTEAGFYEDLSIVPLAESLAEHSEVAVSDPYKYSFCMSRNWAHLIFYFMPKIRDINARRPPANKLIVTSVDELSSFADSAATSSKNYTPGNCELPPHYSRAYALVQSIDRESGTAHRFFNNVWNRMGKDDKAIVFYHYGHLVKHIEGCMPHRIDEDRWTSDWNSLSWFESFLKMAPDARGRTKTVAFDEDEENIPLGAFEFNRRQSKRYANQDFGVELEPFSSVSVDKGLDNFTDETRFHRDDFPYRSDSLLPEMFDALVWSPNSSSDFKLSDPSTYLPSHCDP